MKRTFISISLLFSVICHITNVQAFNDDLIKSYSNLFQVFAPQKVAIKEGELKQFKELISKYLNQGKTEFGKFALFYSVNITIVNGSLIVGYTRGEGKSVVSSSYINAVKEKYENLYVPLYGHIVPLGMINKYPEYVLDHSIIPTYAKLVDFKNVRANYLELLDLPKIPEPGQLLMVQAITGFASGIALAKRRKVLKQEDIEIAKTIACGSWPECGRMLASSLFQFYKEYQTRIEKTYWHRQK